jgi:uncharacterized protein YkwD
MPLRHSPLLLVALILTAAFARGQAPGPELDRVAHQIIDRTNRFRQDQHRPAVTVNEQLSATARDFAGWMAATDLYGHEADGRRPWDRAKAHGYDYCLVAENIAYAWRSAGFTTDELTAEFVQGWEQSPGHRKNMLDPDVTETGVGVARSADTGLYYAVQLFGRPKSLRIEFRIADRAGAAVKYKVGDQAYDLRPRTIMTHEVCRPTDVTLLAADGSAAATVRPANGERYAVTRDENGVLRLAKE